MGTRAETTKKENGYPPSVREIGKAIGLSSTATVHAYLEKLEKDGYIKKEDKKGRTLKIIKGSNGEPYVKSSKDFCNSVFYGIIFLPERNTQAKYLRISDERKRYPFRQHRHEELCRS